MVNDEEDHALVADEVAPTEFALMANTSAESKVFDNSLCSKDCKKNNDSLNSKITYLTDKLFDANNFIYHYKLALPQVESRLVEYKEREVKYIEKIKTLEYYNESYKECNDSLKKKLETLQQEKEGVDGKLAGLLTASKDLDNLIEIQRPSPTVESISEDDQNRNPSEIVASPVTSKPFIKFVKPKDSQSDSKTDKKETPKKPSVKYSEQYKKPNMKPNVRGNQRNWNNMKSHQLGPDFIMKKKACFNCGNFNHLANDCRKRVKKNFTPRLVAHKPYRPSQRQVKTHMDDAWPNKTYFNKQAHSYTNRPVRKTSAVRSPTRAPWVPTVNRKYSPINRKFSTSSRNFPTANRKFPTASRKFPTGGTKSITADMGLKGKALKPSACCKPQDHCSTKVPEGSGNSNPTASTSNPPTDQMETLTLETLIPTVSSPVPTTYFTDSQEPSSDTRLISKRVANQEETQSLDNIISLTTRFEDILGGITNLNESNGEEADTSNMETVITASPTPTLRIHKDHPKSQIIGPMDTLIQTKNKSKELGRYYAGRASSIQNPECMDFVDCPKGVRPIGTKWVHKNKKDERGIVIRNKARIVAQGHTQEERIDYDEVFAPVARIKAIRLFLGYASFIGFTVYQMDVKSAFLYGTIDEEVYVMQPLGFQDPEFPAKVYKVEKAMYGLHQAPRAWYGTLLKYLLKNGFHRGTIDQTLFIRNQSKDFILVQVYVDDIIFGSSNLQLCREFKALMHDKFQMSAMRDILKKFRYSDVRSSNTPMDKENPWGKDGTRKDVYLHLYRSMIGSLMYLTASRPDIMFANLLQLLAAVDKFCGFRISCLIMEIRHHFIRDCFEKKLISMDHIHTDENVADLLTKAFDAGRFQYLVCKLFPLLGKLSTVSVFLGFGLTFVGTSKYYGVLRMLMIGLRLIPLFWSTARINTMDKGTYILTTVDGIQRTVSESSLRRNLKLREEDGIVSIPDTELFENLTLMGIVPLFDTMLVHQGEGSGTPTEPHHTPFPEAETSHPTTSSIPLPSIPTAPIPPVTQPDPTPIRQYTRRARIAQSSALLTVADEPLSFVRVVSKGEACPTDSGFIADQDRATIAKSSTLPHDSAPRVTSPTADEGSMQHNIFELTALCTSLQRQYSELQAKFQAQEEEIVKLKDRVKVLEDKEDVAVTQSGDDAPIKGRSINKGEAAAKTISNDSEEIARVLTSMDATTVLAGGIDKSEYNIDFHPMVDFLKASPLRQYTRRTRIAQSSVPPTIADEPASPQRDISQGEACPTDSDFIADSDRTTIDKSSTLSHDTAPRVTSPATVEGTQEVEINRLKERVKQLEERERVAATNFGDDAPIKGRSMDEEEASTNRVSNDTEEMETMLASMDATTVLASEVVDVLTGSGSIPTATTLVDGLVPTGSEEVPTASPIFATSTVVTPVTRRKGKEVMVDSETPKKQKVQEQIDAQVTRELEEQLAREDQRRAEQIAKDAEIARIHAEEELQSMIDGLDSNNETSQQRKSWTKKQKRDYYMAVIRNNLGWKVKDFRGITFEEVEAKFNLVCKQMEDFIPMGLKEEAEMIKRKEGQRSYWKIIRLGGSSACYQFFIDLLKHLDREDLNQLWRLVKETLNNRPPSSDKEMELWVELNRMKWTMPEGNNEIYYHSSTFPIQHHFGRPGLKQLRAIPSTIYEMMKLPTPWGIATLISQEPIIFECRREGNKQAVKRPEEIELQEKVSLTEQVDGSWRMCIDFKNLNSACSKDYCPLLEIDSKIEPVVRPLDCLLLSFSPALEYYGFLGYQRCNSPWGWEFHHPMDGGRDGSDSNIATALVCLATNRTYNFSKMTFDGLVNNVNNKEVEINRLKERVKQLEERERVAATNFRDDAPIKGRSMDEEEAATNRVSDDTEEMETMLASMDAATVLASEVVDVLTGSGSIPTATTLVDGLVPTGSEEVPTASPIFATSTVVTPVTRRKGKEVMVDSETPKKQKVQEKIDAKVTRELEEQLAREDQRRAEQIAKDTEIARIHAEEELQSMIDGLDSNNETVAKYLEEYRQFLSELHMEKRIELISDLVKDFRGITFKEVEAKFNLVCKQMEDFIPMGSKEEAETIKRKEGQRSYWKIIRLGGSSACYQFFIDLLKHLDREDLNQLWRLVKETLNNRPPSSDKEMELWVELNRMYEPDKEDQLLEEENDDYQKDEELDLEDIFQIQDVILREKLLSINRLIADIESLNDNPTLDRMLNSSTLIPIFKESDNSLLNSSSLEFETFSDHMEETRSGSTTTHANNSLSEYDSLCFKIEPNQERLIYVVKSNIFDNLTNPLFPRPPLEPPDVESFFDFEPNSE
nr:hypothetical protein [Tanacetum cinerariifolium]